MNRYPLKSPRFGGHALSVMAKGKEHILCYKEMKQGWRKLWTKAAKQSKLFWTKKLPSLSLWESSGPAQPLFFTGLYWACCTEHTRCTRDTRYTGYTLSSSWAVDTSETRVELSVWNRQKAPGQVEPSQHFKDSIVRLRAAFTALLVSRWECAVVLLQEHRVATASAVGDTGVIDRSSRVATVTAWCVSPQCRPEVQMEVFPS